jgi:nucleobase:cation symporter-1, NCS1 family
VQGIREVERYGAPLLIAMCAALWVWAITTAGGWGPVLNVPSQFAAGMPKAGQWWSTFLPVVTANVGFWSTLALNVPDFTRYAKSQRAQVVGQAIGLPVTMAVFAFFAMTVTAATKVG